MPVLIGLLACLAASGPAFAHDADPHGASYPWTSDPWILAPLIAICALYLIGLARLKQRSGRLSNLTPGILWFWAGVACLGLALVSPLHWLGEHLFTFHMIEHEIVMTLAAPALVMARPVGVLMWGLPQMGRLATARAMQMRSVRRAWSWLSGGTNATLLHGVIIWTWHVPGLFEAAVSNASVHRLQHLAFFASAMLFWWAVLRRCEHGPAAWQLFVTMIHTGVLGALMALSPRVLYAVQTKAAAQWGLSPLEDQQLAGMIMWVPAGTIYAGAALAMLLLLISDSSGRRAHDA